MKRSMPHDITELWTSIPSFDFAKDVPFRHEVWMLEFKYKPIRMILADLPVPTAACSENKSGTWSTR